MSALRAVAAVCCSLLLSYGGQYVAGVRRIYHFAHFRAAVQVDDVSDALHSIDAIARNQDRMQQPVESKRTMADLVIAERHRLGLQEDALANVEPDKFPEASCTDYTIRKATCRGSIRWVEMLFKGAASRQNCQAGCKRRAKRKEAQMCCVFTDYGCFATLDDGGIEDPSPSSSIYGFATVCSLSPISTTLPHRFQRNPVVAARCISKSDTDTWTCTGGDDDKSWEWLNMADLAGGDSDVTACQRTCLHRAEERFEELCCTSGLDGCWAMRNHGPREVADGELSRHTGWTVVCAPSSGGLMDLSASLQTWADVTDTNFMPNGKLANTGYWALQSQENMFNNVGVDSISQGVLGNCGLIATISSFGLYPLAVRRVIAQQFASSKGEYSLQLWDYGHSKWVRVNVDDYFYLDKSRLKYSRTRRQINDAAGVWPMLLEKAFAKLFNGFEELEEMRGVHAMTALTGSSENVVYGWQEKKQSWYPFKVVGITSSSKVRLDIEFDRQAPKKNSDELWELVRKANGGSQLLIASCCRNHVPDIKAKPGHSANEKAKLYNLRAPHGYSVISVIDIGRDVYPRLRSDLKIYEPWNSFPPRFLPFCWDQDKRIVVHSAMCNGAGIGKFERRGERISSIDWDNFQPGSFRFVKLRNPWGWSPYDGPWSYSPGDTGGQRDWDNHNDLKTAMGFDLKEAEQGIAWMPWEIFRETFYAVEVGSQEMLTFDPTPPECNTQWGANVFKQDLGNGRGSIDHQLMWKLHTMTMYKCGHCECFDSRLNAIRWATGEINININDQQEEEGVYEDVCQGVNVPLSGKIGQHLIQDEENVLVCCIATGTKFAVPMEQQL